MTDKIEIDIRNIPFKKFQELCEKTKLLKCRHPGNIHWKCNGFELSFSAVENYEIKDNILFLYGDNLVYRFHMPSINLSDTHT
jgi:hypothetical protein